MERNFHVGISVEEFAIQGNVCISRMKVVVRYAKDRESTANIFVWRHAIRRQNAALSARCNQGSNAHVEKEKRMWSVGRPGKESKRN